ncbi:hypothetical protein MSPP1_002216 [Malassezia sp. CBS 17886]|nr:hypothetical protein MSPP1_002216 [Malassezia sp. CBS 17886]
MDVDALWAFQAHRVTRERRHRIRGDHATDNADGSASDDAQDDDVPLDHNLAREGVRGPGEMGPAAVRPQLYAREASVLSEQAEDRRWLRSTNVVARAGSTQQTAELRTRKRTLLEARRAARGEHLPWRGEVAERARILRALKGLPPLGSCADADQLSDWEDAFEHAKIQRVRHGESDIVQIGRRRTLAEEEMSHHGDDLVRPPAPDHRDSSFANAWDASAATLARSDLSSSVWSGEASMSVASLRGRPRMSLPQRWTPHNGPAAAALAALDHAAYQHGTILGAVDESADMDLVDNLDADVEDLDDEDAM